jgi:TolA-binding protein
MRAVSLKSFVLMITVYFAVASCKQENTTTHTKEKQDSAAVPSKRQFTDPITSGCSGSYAEAKKMDSILLNQLEVDPPSANKAIKAFTDYAYYCQNDTLAPVYLIKAAQVSRAVSNYNQAKTVLDFCIENYPKFRDRPAALFLLAQLYDENTQLNNEAESRRLYDQIINEYPKSDWAVSAEGAKRFLGKSDEEIMKEIQRKK